MGWESRLTSYRTKRTFPCRLAVAVSALEAPDCLRKEERVEVFERRDDAGLASLPTLERRSTMMIDLNRGDKRVCVLVWEMRDGGGVVE